MIIPAVEKKIQENLNNISSAFSQLDMMEELNLHIESDEYESLKDEYKTLIRSTSLQIQVYLELNELDSYLLDFKQKFNSKIENNQIYDRYFHSESGNTYSQIYLDFWQFLSPFSFIQPDDFESIYTKKGLFYLERILKNSDILVKLRKAPINNEADIYNSIKPFIEILFPSVINSTGSAIFSKLKKYKPDIMIPELFTAVEYKYVNSEPDISLCITAIADDVIGYQDKIGTTDYRLFYSVFFITKVDKSEERFLEFWKERNYPENWKVIFVFERS
jgi:hypothetical protein